MADIKLCAFADEADDALAGQIKAMQENGIGYLELRTIDKKNITKFTNEEVKEYKKQLDDAGIKVWSIGSPIGKIKITDDFAAELDLCKRTIEIANMFDAKSIRMFSFYGTNGEAQYRDEVMERLSKYVEAARGSGVTLCHENEKGIYGDIAVRCREIHETLPELKCVFDPANFVQSGQDTLEAWAMLEPYVFYGHIKDSLADGSIVPPGKGLGHIPEYLPKFVAKGCNVLTLEPHLSVFSALASLEEEGEESKIGLYKFASKREAFDCAVNSLKDIIKEI
ncbi:MAG: sugar phosphate isomerase/epimerase [Clostridia bacterium]|nr:sugar phosphate isomerase/epimerase [Clostridia bacterium]